PALRASGYRVGSPLDPIRPGFTPRRVLAERTGIPPRTVDRVCAGSQRTITTVMAITILQELQALHAKQLLAELQAELARWKAAIFGYHYARYEYLDKLALLAP